MDMAFSGVVLSVYPYVGSYHDPSLRFHVDTSLSQSVDWHRFSQPADNWVSSSTFSG